MIFLLSIAIPLTIIIHHWRESIGGLIVRSLKEDEWGSLSLGARISGHQRLSGYLAGFLSAFAGAYFASIIRFIEPRNYQPTALLLPIAAMIFGAGKIPQRIIAAAIGLTVLSQGIRFLGVSSSASGPVAEMIVALILGMTIVYSKIHKQQLNY